MHTWWILILNQYMLPSCSRLSSVQARSSSEFTTLITWTELLAVLIQVSDVRMRTFDATHLKTLLL